MDRAKLGEIIFSDPKMRKKLDNAVKFPIWTALMANVAWHWFTCKKMIVRLLTRMQILSIGLDANSPEEVEITLILNAYFFKSSIEKIAEHFIY